MTAGNGIVLAAVVSETLDETKSCIKLKLAFVLPQKIIEHNVNYQMALADLLTHWLFNVTN